MNKSHMLDVSTISRKQVGWFLFFRLLTSSLLLFATIAYQQQSQGEGSGYPLRWLYFLVAFSYAQNLLATVLVKRIERFELLIQSQTAWDLVFSAFFIYLTGGIGSPFTFLFILIILSSAAFSSRRQSLVVASASSILYGSLLDLQYYGYLPLRNLDGELLRPSGYHVLYTIFANVLAFYLTAFLGGMLAERLRSSEQALKKKEIDYDELDSLNRAIVANIGSGLMTINRQGRIRVFNQGAERITGLSLVDVYNREVRKVFPDLRIYDGDFILQTRGEGGFAHADGKRRFIGYATSLIEAGGETDSDLLIAFQDLTRLKEAEERLRRNDRLAAVGQLAAGLAHEIRNPLASISGSVQLLIEGGSISPEDQKLMRIVVKEADRLNLLLGDFLLFARPAPPQQESVDLSEMLDEIVSFVAADLRFAAINLHRDYRSGVILRCDRSQMRQAVLNLVINAAEELPAGGDVWLGLDLERRTIVVEDSGSGIPVELHNRIFNPFFTTKPSGTGLGLATVHAILEAHGGTVELGRGRSGGARFELRLPAIEEPE